MEVGTYQMMTGNRMSPKEIKYWNSLDSAQFHVKSCLCDKCKLDRIRKRQVARGIKPMTKEQESAKRDLILKQIAELEN
ncbi:hypothetical protein [Lactococcus lactis]|uniref:hypothetical protein n=1 Tax=Lactococcus lactis TaxID=1358 RepID=UPI0018AA8160|nr:hypothetical protein [Lactococcus lactis]BDH81166.1 hypothetical protein LLL8_08230 [Lactococcus lactis]